MAHGVERPIGVLSPQGATFSIELLNARPPHRPHKTASTYLQANFSRQRAELLRKGWLYPTTGVRTGIAHHDIAEDWAGIIEGSGPAFDDMRAVARKARARNVGVLLSAEGFRRWNARQIGALADMFDCRAPKLVYVLRDPMTVLRSMWAQSVKLGKTDELPRFLARHARDPERSRLLNPLRDLQPHLRGERAGFTILLYDELARRKRDIYSAFMSEALSIEGALPSAEVVNPRPELELTEFLRLISISGGYQSLENRVDVGDAVRHLFSPEERAAIVATIREKGAGALRTIEIRRDTPHYDDLERRLRKWAESHFRPRTEAGRLFPTEPETWRYYNSTELMRAPAVRELIERAAVRLKRRGVLVAVMNQGFRTLMAGRRLRNIVSARLR